MRIDGRSWRVARAGFLGLAFAVAGTAAGQASPPPAREPATLEMLLEEVRLLREAVQQSTLVSLKVQVTLQRLSTQDLHVRGLAEQLSQFESGVTNSQSEQERLRGELAQVEERMGQEGDPNARRALAEQRTSLREGIERETSQEQEMRRRAAELSQLLQGERARSDELTRALGELERALLAPPRRRPAGAGDARSR
jgi:hypothetical protein